MPPEADALERHLSQIQGYPSLDEGAIGSTLLQAAHAVVTPEKAQRLEGIDAERLASEIIFEIDRMNRGSSPDTYRSPYDPQSAIDFLRKKLIYIGALPVPQTDINKIIASMGYEAAPKSSEDRAFDGLLAKLPLAELRLRVIDDHGVGMMLSGEGKIKECIKLASEYASAHPDEIDEMIREIWHAGHFCNNAFITDEERGERAKIYASIQDLLQKHGDSHHISIAFRTKDFTEKVLRALLAMKGYVFILNTGAEA